MFSSKTLVSPASPESLVWLSGFIYLTNIISSKQLKVLFLCTRQDVLIFILNSQAKDSRGGNKTIKHITGRASCSRFLYNTRLGWSTQWRSWLLPSCSTTSRSRLSWVASPRGLSAAPVSVVSNETATHFELGTSAISKGI